MENDIPKIDLPQDWVIGKLSEKDIGLLNLYANYPCRLKAGIFVLCLRGEVEASINLTQFKVEAGSFITILPGTISRFIEWIEICKFISWDSRLISSIKRISINRSWICTMP